MFSNTLEEEERAKGFSLDSMITHRETRVEMIQCPTWGIACFMDGVIQSCEMDEAMIRQVLGSEVHLQACIMDGHQSCSFLVSPKVGAAPNDINVRS